jgi:hypothetical protein
MRRLRVLAPVAAAIILATLGIAYYFTVEPAPTLKIRWRAGVTPGERAEVERRFRLVKPTPDQPRTYRYDLLDTRASNIEALVHDPAVEDTADIDTVHYVLPPDYPYGKSWTWAAYRMPILRAPGVVDMLVGISAIALIERLGEMLWIARRRRTSAHRSPPA